MEMRFSIGFIRVSRSPCFVQLDRHDIHGHAHSFKVARQFSIGFIRCSGVFFQALSEERS